MRATAPTRLALALSSRTMTRRLDQGTLVGGVAGRLLVLIGSVVQQRDGLTRCDQGHDVVGSLAAAHRVDPGVVAHQDGPDKPDLYDPKINRSYADLAEHYGVLVDPARADVFGVELESPAPDEGPSDRVRAKHLFAR